MGREPEQHVAVYRGKDIPRVMSNYRSGGFEEILLSRWAGDWGLGEGEMTAFVRTDEIRGTDLVIMIRHSINNPLGGSSSILEFIPLYLEESASKDLAMALLGYQKEEVK